MSFIDSDDFISSDFYEANMEFLEQNPDIDMMILPYCKYSDTDNVLYKNDPQTLFNKTDVLNYLFSNKYNCAVWRCIYKVDIFLYSRFAEGRLFEDGYILPEIAQCVSSLVISVAANKLKLLIESDSINSSVTALVSDANSGNAPSSNPVIVASSLHPVKRLTDIAATKSTVINLPLLFFMFLINFKIKHWFVIYNKN